MTTRDEIIALALRSGASVGKWGDAVLSADSLQQFAKEIERQAYERAAVACDCMADGWENNPGNNPMAGYIASSNCAAAIRALIEGDGK